MLERDSKLSTEQKALSINLNESVYGTVVEIGAGQEVARQFFAAGGAAGTIAKTMSAYDMRVSDEIYGKAHRYVSRERLQQMLTHEFDLLVSRLSEVRSRNTTFFTYAATVSARGYQKATECHGWIGLRLQLRPGEDPNDIVLHVRMLDEENRMQSEALGVLGINLIHAAYHHANRPEWIIESLLDNIGRNRIEVDLIRFTGPAFRFVENRLMNLHLIRAWLTRAVMFDAKGQSVAPCDMFYKRPVMVMRGTFKPPTVVHEDMLRVGRAQFAKIDSVDEKQMLVMAEITMNELVSGDRVDDSDFLARVDLLNSLGWPVLISDYVRFFRLRSWLRQFTQCPIGIVISVLDFSYLFDEKYYDGVEGGILEAMGKLFPDNTHVFVYPARIKGELVTLENVQVPERQKHLLRYLLANQLLIPAEGYCPEHLHVTARELIKHIAAGEDGWQASVPAGMAEQIMQRKLFGWR